MRAAFKPNAIRGSRKELTVVPPYPWVFYNIPPDTKIYTYLSLLYKMVPGLEKWLSGWVVALFSWSSGFNSWDHNKLINVWNHLQVNLKLNEHKHYANVYTCSTENQLLFSIFLSLCCLIHSFIKVSWSPDCPQTQYVPKAGLEHLVLLPPPLECWVERYIPHHPLVSIFYWLCQCKPLRYRGLLYL